MRVLAERDGRLYAALQADPALPLPAPFRGEPFVCMIWDHEGRFSKDQMFAVAGALLDAGCRYVVCGGERCELWHDIVDEEFLSRHLDGPDDDRRAVHVMTSWHDGEEPDDVAFFFVLCTEFDDLRFRRFLVLHAGSGPLVELVNKAVRKYARK